MLRELHFIATDSSQVFLTYINESLLSEIIVVDKWI